MSEASDLIERLEQETGQRVDEPGSAAMAGLFGAMSRMLGQSPPTYTKREDIAAGVLIQHQMTPEYERDEVAKKMLAEMLRSGMSPDDAVALMGNGK